MATKVGELSFDFVINAGSIDSSFSRVENRVGQLDSSIKKVGQSGVKMDTRSAEASITTLTGKVGLLQKAIGGIATGAGFAIANAAMNTLGNAVQKVGGFAYEAAIGFNDFEQGALKGFGAMLGSAGKAQDFMKQLTDFANGTPFEIKGLVTASQQLMAFGINAEQVIPLLTDIGNVSSYFHSGEEGIAAMTRAIGQMNAATILHTQDLYQMLNVGVPVWDILSQGLHKSVPEVQEMVSKGQIASSTFIELFDTWSKAPERANQMKAANSTLEGSMSTIHDVVQKLFADGFKPLYDVITAVANKAADMAASGALTKWGDNIAHVVGAVVDVLKKIPDAWNEISSFIERSGGIVGALDVIKGKIIAWVMNTATDLLGAAPSWIQAGVKLMESFGQGMWDAVTGTVQAVFNAVADFIGSFFIGQSPPPNGPLSRIEEGGRILMETYANGMAAGTDGVKYVAQSITDILGTIDSRGILDGLIAGIGGMSLDDLKTAAASVGDAIAAIDGAEQQLNFTIDDTQLKIDTINQSYDAQIEPLQKAADLLAQQRDYVREMNDLQLELQDVNLKIEEHNDKNLQSLIKQRDAMQAGMKGGAQGTDPLTVQIQNLTHQLQSMPNDKAHQDQRKAIQNNINDLKYQQQQQANLSKDQKANAQQNLDAINQQIDAIQGGYKARQADIDFQKEGNSLAEQKGKIEADIAQAPYLQQIDELNKKRKEAIDPLQKQLDALNAQKKLLDDQKKVWEDIKAVIDPVVASMEKANKEADAAAKKGLAGTGGSKAGGGAAKPVLPTGPGAGGKIPGIDSQAISDGIFHALEKSAEDTKKSMGDKARQLGEHFLKVAGDYLKENAGHIIGAAIGGALGGVLGPIGTVAGSLLGGKLGEEIQKRLKGVNWHNVMQAVHDGLATGIEFIRNIVEEAGQLWDKYGPQVKAAVSQIVPAFKSMTEGIGTGIKAILPTLRDELFPALVKMAGIFVEVILPAVMKFIGWWAENVVPPLVYFYSTVINGVLDALIAFAGWFTNTGIPAIQAFAGWVNDNIVPALAAFGGFIGDTVVPALQAFGDFVVNTILPALAQFGSFVTDTVLPALAAFGGWITDNVIPPLQAFADFVSTHVMAILGELGNFFTTTVMPLWTQFTGWVNTTLLPLFQAIVSVLQDVVLPAFKVVWGIIGSLMMNTANVIMNSWDGIKEVFSGALTIILASVTTTFGLVKNAIELALKTIGSVVEAAWKIISATIDTALNTIRGLIQIGHGLITGNFTEVWNGIKLIVSGAWGLLQTIVETAINLVRTTIGNVFGFIRSDIDVAFTGIEGIFSGAWTIIQGALTIAWEAFKTTISDSINFIKDKIIDPAWSAIEKIFTDSTQAVIDAILAPFKGARDGIGAIIEAFKGNMATPWNLAADGINGFVKGMADAINWIAGKMQLKFVINTNDLAKIPKFASGGVTPGGPIIVGEEGPELMFPGAGHGILSHDKSVAALKDAMPDFWGGPLDVATNLWGSVGKIKGEVGRAVSAFVKKGFEWIVSEAMKVAGIDGGLLGDAGGLFKDIGGAIFQNLKDGLLEFVKDLVDQSKGHIGGSTGTWIFPVPGGSPGQGSFGSYSHSQIAAVDIGAGRGSTIVAPDGGEIMFDGQNGWSGGTGHTMMMQHDNDWVTLYGHVSAVLGKLGDAFEQGEAVAKVGDPAIDGGIGSGAHLHFEMFHNHARVRPEDYIPGWGGAGTIKAYGNGGLITEPVNGVGSWTGMRYAFGEKGVETVTPGNGNGGGTEIHVHGDVTIPVTTQPGQSARDIADAIHEEFVVGVRRGGYQGA